MPPMPPQLPSPPLPPPLPAAPPDPPQLPAPPAAPISGWWNLQYTIRLANDVESFGTSDVKAFRRNLAAVAGVVNTKSVLNTIFTPGSVLAAATISVPTEAWQHRVAATLWRMSVEELSSALNVTVELVELCSVCTLPAKPQQCKISVMCSSIIDQYAPKAPPPTSPPVPFAPDAAPALPSPRMPLDISAVASANTAASLDTASTAFIVAVVLGILGCFLLCLLLYCLLCWRKRKQPPPPPAEKDEKGTESDEPVSKHAEKSEQAILAPSIPGVPAPPSIITVGSYSRPPSMIKVPSYSRFRTWPTATDKPLDPLSETASEASSDGPAAKQLRTEHRSVKSELRFFSANFAKRHGRAPERESEWGPVQPRYDRYRTLSELLHSHRAASALRHAGQRMQPLTLVRQRGARDKILPPGGPPSSAPVAVQDAARAPEGPPPPPPLPSLPQRGKPVDAFTLADTNRDRKLDKAEFANFLSIVATQPPQQQPSGAPPPPEVALPRAQVQLPPGPQSLPPPALVPLAAMPPPLAAPQPTPATAPAPKLQRVTGDPSDRCGRRRAPARKPGAETNASSASSACTAQVSRSHARPMMLVKAARTSPPNRRPVAPPAERPVAPMAPQPSPPQGCKMRPAGGRRSFDQRVYVGAAAPLGGGNIVPMGGPSAPEVPGSSRPPRPR